MGVVAAANRQESESQLSEAVVNPAARERQLRGDGSLRRAHHLSRFFRREAEKESQVDDTAFAVVRACRQIAPKRPKPRTPPTSRPPGFSAKNPMPQQPTASRLGRAGRRSKPTAPKRAKEAGAPRALKARARGFGSGSGLRGPPPLSALTPGPHICLELDRLFELQRVVGDLDIRFECSEADRAGSGLAEPFIAR